MSNAYQHTYRGYLIDHHSPDPPVVTLDKLNADEYEAFFKEANINHLMLYCKDHWGVTYYDTNLGKRHPGLKEDWIAKLKPVLKKLNIEFNAYYCLEYDSYAPDAHPEWSIRQANGEPLKLTGRIPKWGMPCYETGYRQYALGQLAEIVAGYRPDSLFLDIFGKSLCYCAVCRHKFQAVYGFALPEDENGLNGHYREINEFLDSSAKDMLREIICTVKAIDPDIKVTINFAALYSKEIRDMLDYQFTEPWAGNWLSAAYARDTAIGQFPQLGPGEVSEVYNFRRESVYVLAAAQIAAQGCRVFMYSGSQRPDGTLEHEEARRIGKAYREVAAFEPFLQHREVIADIGIVQSDFATSIKSASAVVTNAIERVRAGSEHRNAVLGAMKLCDSLKYTWSVIPEQQLTMEKLQSYKAIVLPDVYYISDSLKQLLTTFVDDGGVLIASGQTGLFDEQGRRTERFSLSELYGCDFVKVVEDYRGSEWGSYLKPVADTIWKYTPETYPAASEYRYLVTNVTGNVLATFINPATELSEDKWVNWWYPPPSAETGDPAVIENEAGHGKVVYAAFDMFQMENKGYHLLKGIFKGVIEKYVPNPKLMLETDTPETIGFVAYDRPEHRELIIHELSHMAELAGGDTPEIPGGVLKIGTDYKHVTTAELVYPQREQLQAVDDGNGFWEIRLPSLSIHQIIRIGY